MRRFSFLFAAVLAVFGFASGAMAQTVTIPAELVPGAVATAALALLGPAMTAILTVSVTLFLVGLVIHLVRRRARGIAR